MNMIYFSTFFEIFKTTQTQTEPYINHLLPLSYNGTNEKLSHSPDNSEISKLKIVKKRKFMEHQQKSIGDESLKKVDTELVVKTISSERNAKNHGKYKDFENKKQQDYQKDKSLNPLEEKESSGSEIDLDDDFITDFLKNNRSIDNHFDPHFLDHLSDDSTSSLCYKIKSTSEFVENIANCDESNLKTGAKDETHLVKPRIKILKIEYLIPKDKLEDSDADALDIKKLNGQKTLNYENCSDVNPKKTNFKLRQTQSRTKISQYNIKIRESGNNRLKKTDNLHIPIKSDNYLSQQKFCKTDTKEILKNPNCCKVQNFDLQKPKTIGAVRVDKKLVNQSVDLSKIVRNDYSYSLEYDAKNKTIHKNKKQRNQVTDPTFRPNNVQKNDQKNLGLINKSVITLFIHNLTNFINKKIDANEFLGCQGKDISSYIINQQIFLFEQFLSSEHEVFDDLKEIFRKYTETIFTNIKLKKKFELYIIYKNDNYMIEKNKFYIECIQKCFEYLNHKEQNEFLLNREQNYNNVNYKQKEYICISFLVFIENSQFHEKISKHNYKMILLQFQKKFFEIVIKKKNFLKYYPEILFFVKNINMSYNDFYTSFSNFYMLYNILVVFDILTDVDLDKPDEFFVSHELTGNFYHQENFKKILLQNQVRYLFSILISSLISNWIFHNYLQILNILELNAEIAINSELNSDYTKFCLNFDNNLIDQRIECPKYILRSFFYLHNNSEIIKTLIGIKNAFFFILGFMSLDPINFNYKSFLKSYFPDKKILKINVCILETYSEEHQKVQAWKEEVASLLDKIKHTYNNFDELIDESIYLISITEPLFLEF
ncbi:hypothetical protein GVAV_002988 [Gurleya vavrai]